MQMIIGIVDYGAGNIGSLINAFNYIKVKSEIVSDPKALMRCQALILPGVGSFGSAMQTINRTNGLREALETKAFDHAVPILGICLGMQLMTESSDESTANGLGWFESQTIRLKSSTKAKVPRMGWNETISTKHSPSLEHQEMSRFYYSHSYHVVTHNRTDVIMTAEYDQPFDAAIQKHNLYGVQFHPEKSSKTGINLLKKFVNVIKNADA